MIIIENRWHIFRLRCTRLFSPATHTHTYAQAKQVNIFKSVIALKGKCKSTVEIYFLKFLSKFNKDQRTFRLFVFPLLRSQPTKKREREKMRSQLFYMCQINIIVESTRFSTCSIGYERNKSQMANFFFSYCANIYA